MNRRKKNRFSLVFDRHLLPLIAHQMQPTQSSCDQLLTLRLHFHALQTSTLTPSTAAAIALEEKGNAV
jgi:hypothetical protein